ncbi:MAG: molybdopterin molybdotransferase MoeA [Oscillospiraceae bacterium]|nr:molybdopterin molybdotransferase MoeA [Oscillospiraceae bacterium]
MLNVLTPTEVIDVINKHFTKTTFQYEKIFTVNSVGRILHTDIISNEDVPGFDRSTVDGYAVRASDTFGSSESIPAVMTVTHEILMGKIITTSLNKETDENPANITIDENNNPCVAISTGGAVPEGFDAVVMVEHTESYSDNMIGISKPVAPGNNIIFKGDDVSKGDLVLKAGAELTVHDVGVLAALGFEYINVRKKPRIGIISTGDELVNITDTPSDGEVRDVNGCMLAAAAKKYGGIEVSYGIVRDDEESLINVLKNCIKNLDCDIILISGGSSAGDKDKTAKVIESLGELLFHGIAIKPGKPTILGIVNEKPVFGLPGHPVAAYMVFELFVREVISCYLGTTIKRKTTIAKLNEAISANHGREEIVPVKLVNGVAIPIKGKSGLISKLIDINGYIIIPRNCEGLSKGTEVELVYV